jgi:hypothetical protein
MVVVEDALMSTLSNPGLEEEKDRHYREKTAHTDGVNSSSQ